MSDPHHWYGEVDPRLAWLSLVLLGGFVAVQLGRWLARSNAQRQLEQEVRLVRRRGRRWRRW